LPPNHDQLSKLVHSVHPTHHSFNHHHTLSSAMKSAVIATTLLVATGSAMAASSVPTGISAPCAAYLNKLDTDTTLSSCTTSINGAVKAFSTSSGSSSDAASALSKLCGADVESNCSASTLRTTLSSFYSACTAELSSSPNDNVKLIYDSLYTISPMRASLCAKDDSGATCGASSASVSLGTSNSQSVLGSTAPNVSGWQSSGAAFLFLTPSLTSDKCVPCTRQIVNSYISWESQTMYAPGLGGSLLLQKQGATLAQVKTVCGDNFLSGVNGVGNAGSSVVGNAKSGAQNNAKAGAMITFGTAVLGAAILF
jgi:hypothetical protein